MPRSLRHNEFMTWWKWGLLAVSAIRLFGDTLTLSAGPDHITRGAGKTLTVTANATNVLTFERLYAGNSYFYLRTGPEAYVATNPATGTLALTARDTATAEQFQTSSAANGAVNLLARSTGGYVEVVGTALAANASSSKATAFTLNATADGTLRIEVDFANPRQKIVGFGAADAFYTNWLTAHPNKEQIYSLLFGPDNLGASILRVQNIYGQTSTTPFDPDTAEVVAKANSYRGSPIAVLMTSWSPPAALKASGQVSCNGASVEPGCTLAKANGGYNYSGFAQYWSNSLNAYAALGVTPNYVSLQNEPDFTPSGYAGCRFDPAEEPGGTYAGYREALDAVYAQLQTMPNPPVLVGPEVAGIGYNDPENYLSALSPAEVEQMGAVAHHLYGGDSGSPDSFDTAMFQLAAAAPSTQLFETEFDHSADQSTAMDTAWLIHNAMAVEEASAYLYWSYFWPDTNQLVYIDNPFTPSTWVYPQGFHPNDYFYAVEHFSKYVQPGFQRIASLTGSAELRVTGYYNGQSHRLVLVLVNTSAGDTLTPAVALPAPSPRSGAPPAGPTAVYRSTFSGAERFASLGPLAAGNVVTLPPQSVATVVVDNYIPGFSQ